METQVPGSVIWLPSAGMTARTIGLSMTCLAFWLVGGALGAHAGRFGPPWQSRVSAETTTVYTQADLHSVPVGPLPRGALVVVLAELKSADGADWSQVASGFVLSADIAEDRSPWIAEVVVPTLSVYALPDAKSAIRRTVTSGALLRVTGAARGVDGDASTWWGTTEGYVGLETIAESNAAWAKQWQLPARDEATQGWWGAVRSQANVRVGPTTDGPVVGTLVPGDRVKVLEEIEGQTVGGSNRWYRVDGGRYAGAVVHSSLVGHLPEPRPNVTPPPPGTLPGPWIVVDRSAATLTFVGADGEPRFATYVSLGRAGVTTPNGAYETMGKYRADEMTSTSVEDADHAYDLPNVPFTQYYREGGYAIHGTYWHDHFGAVESQGCINVTWTDGAYLFGLTQPDVPVDLNARWATGSQPATPVVILDRTGPVS